MCGGDGHIQQFRVAKSDSLQPADQQIDRGNEPDVAHFGIASGGYKDCFGATFDDQCFEDQSSAWPQGIPQQLQVFNGAGSVIQDSHGHGDVEQCRGVCECVVGQRQQEVGSVIRGISAEEFELHDVEQERIESQHEGGSCFQHSPAVVAVAAADIDDAAAAEIDVAGEAIPFQI